MGQKKKGRWYDVYPEFSHYLERIKEKGRLEREVLMFDMKDMLLTYDAQVMDRNVEYFPLGMKRRWHDKDPYTWLVVNSLRYTDRVFIREVTDFLKENT